MHPSHLTHRFSFARIALVIAAVACTTAPAHAAITNDLYAYTASQRNQFTPGISLNGFGTTQIGGANNTGGFDAASTAWFPDHFGMFARGSMNSSANAQGGQGYAYGFTQESILIPTQQGQATGAVGTLRLKYHIDGTVTHDVGDTTEVGGPTIVSFGSSDLHWSFAKKEIGTDNNDVQLGGLDRQWRGNHLTDHVDQDVIVNVPFHFGKTFYFSNAFVLTATAGSPNPPAVGYAEADFSHTGKLTGGTVLDALGNPLTNPTVQSDSGFDYINPTPEPSTAACAAALALTHSLLRRRRHGRA